MFIHSGVKIYANFGKTYSDFERSEYFLKYALFYTRF